MGEVTGCLRAYQRGATFCPLTAVALAYERGCYPMFRWDEASVALHVAPTDAVAIVMAADGNADALRQALLAAVGLDEEARP